jgi:hypothetical protein
VLLERCTAQLGRPDCRRAAVDHEEPERHDEARKENPSTRPAEESGHRDLRLPIVTYQRQIQIPVKLALSMT